MTQPATSSDFADILQLFLSEAEVEDGYYLAPLVLHSDALTRLDLTVNIEYVRQVSALPTGVDEATLPFTHDSTAQTDTHLLQVALPAGAKVLPGETGVHVLGSFDESRILVGPTGPIDTTTAVSITPQQSQAHPILLDQDLAVTAVDLLLASVSRAAVLNINLIADVDGKPFGKHLLSQPITIELDRDVADKPIWISAALPAEFQFKKEQRIWLTVQAREGEAVWAVAAVTDNSIGLHQTTPDGLAWRITKTEDGAENGRLAGLFRLRHTPNQFEMPLEVLVGENDNTVRVSLERFQPLGRVDFDINTPEFAEAINTVAARAAGTLCPQGEQLKNNQFETWHKLGSGIGAPQQIASSDGIQTLTIAPNGKWAYVSSRQEQEHAGFIALPNHTPDNTFESHSLPNSAQLVAIDAASKRVYYYTNSGPNDSNDALYVIDSETRQIFPGFVHFGFSDDFIGVALALTPDKQRLYLAGINNESDQNELIAIDIALLEEQIHDEIEIPLDAVLYTNSSAAFQNPIPLGSPYDFSRLLSMAVTPDNCSVIVTAVSTDTYSNENNGVIYHVDIQTHALTQIPVPYQPAALAITPDGRWALVVGYTFSQQVREARSLGIVEQLYYFDIVNAVSTTSILLNAPHGNSNDLTTLVINASGTHVFVATMGDAHVHAIDIEKAAIEKTITIGDPTNQTFGIAITPMDDRLYVLVRGEAVGTTVAYWLPISLHQELADWTLTTGFVRPVRYMAEHQLTAVLGPFTQPEREVLNSRPSALSQTVPVVGECNYDFSFWGIACDIDTVAEIIWRGDECGTIQQTDTIPVTFYERPFGTPAANTHPCERNCLAAFAPDLQFHQARLTAPAGATQAEIRFLVPPKSNAAIDTVSFQATTDALTNNGLHASPQGELVGWRLIADKETDIVAVSSAAQIELQNAGENTVSLVQAFTVTGGQSYEFVFRGSVLDATAVAEKPRVELRWVTTAGTQNEQVEQLEIENTPNKPQILRGTVPTGVSSAECHLIIPVRTKIAVAQVSYQPVEIVTVPVNFVAQAPGELVVSDFRVAYDTTEGITRPAPPAGGLCAPTPPGRGTAGDPCACHWCPTICAECSDDSGGEAVSGAETAVRIQANTHPIRVTAATRQPAQAFARPQLTGIDNVVIAAPRPAPDLLRPEAELAELMLAPEAEWISVAGELSAAAIPLTAINGIGSKRAAALAALDINTLPKLGTADATLIANNLEFVTPEIASAYISAAKELLLDPTLRQMPLVSCVMPTADRPHFVPQAVAYFLRQTYPNRELIIVDDGIEPIANLLPDDPHIRIIRLEQKMSIGAKLNLGFAQAKGQIFAKWDDDVWTAPWRLSYQAAAILKHKADICATENCLHYDLKTGKAWHSVRPIGTRRWVTGSTLCFSPAFWHRNPFPDISLGEDIRFVRNAPDAKLLPLQATDFVIDIMHTNNTSPKNSASPRWHPFPSEEIRVLMGDDWQFYAALRQTMPA